MTHPGGFYVQYDYDVTGAVTKVRENGATSGLGLPATYAYDDRGRRTSITRGNGVTTTFAYDAISRLDSLTQDLAGTADDQTLTFSHNPAHQLASRTATNAGYAWAGHVNVNETTTVNGLNQIATEAAVSFYYDDRGNLTSDGETSYWYDADNRLTGATGGASLTYDALGRLYEASGNGMAATRFLYYGAELIAEYDTSGNLQRRFVHGPRADEPLVWYEGTSTSDRRWLIADERGSVIAVTDDTGNPLAINTYDEFGQPGSGNIGRFQYTGQVWIEAVELYYYKARFYAPAQGRFLQTDPIGYGDGLNLYGYAGGDPVNRVDPSGTEDIDERQIADEPIDNITVTGTDWGSILIDFFFGVGDFRSACGGCSSGSNDRGEIDEIVVTAEQPSPPPDYWSVWGRHAWRGTVNIAGIGNRRLSRKVVEFDLTSECVEGDQWHVLIEGTLNGIDASRLSFDAAHSTDVTFYDPFSVPSPTNLVSTANNSMEMYGLSFVSLMGGGSVTLFRLGYTWGISYGLSFGVDYGASVMSGSASVASEEMISSCSAALN